MSPLDAAALDNPQRLQALRDSGLLRHDTTTRLDLLCETASMILRVPMSQVNVQDDRFQTSVGKWPPDDDRVIGIEQTGCREVLTTRAPVVVPNTLLHPVMCMIPFVTIIGARSYLGVPIFFSGQVLGAFCVADFQVREWNTWDIAGLQGLARLAGLAVSHDG